MDVGGDGRELIHELLTAPHDLGPRPRELHVPHIQHLGIDGVGEGLLDEGVALTQRGVVHRRLAVIGRAQLAELHIHEAAADIRAGLYERKILRREHDHVEDAYQLARLVGALPVDENLLLIARGAVHVVAGAELYLDQAEAARSLELQPDVSAGEPVAYELAVAARPVAPPEGAEEHGFEHVRLACGVCPVEQVEAALRAEFGVLIAPESV